MARWTETKITLTTNQATGIDPVIAAETVTPGNRRAMIIGNPGATALNLHLSTGQVAGTGLPLAAAGVLAFDGALPGLDGALYLTGAALGDKITIWTA